MIAASHPILTCPQAGRLEKRLFRGDPALEWAAMQRAGAGVADGVISDFREIGVLPAEAGLLVLAGKGHNAGDALLAAERIVREHPRARVDLCLVFGERALRPLVLRAYRDLAQAAGGRLRVISSGLRGAYDVCLDGVFGFQFHPPVAAEVAGLFRRVNDLPIRFRAAVDLPSAGLFRADFTYATGSVKEPLLHGENRGRVRYLDLGFFPPDAAGRDRALLSAVLAPLAGLRPFESDKRSLGHVMLLGGSRSYPGAIMMSVLAALRSGAGLVTAFVPETLAPAFAARAPEAMWVGWPETPEGGLALEGLHLLKSRLKRADAMVIGPGLGREAETLALVIEIVKSVSVPVVLDADSLQPQVVRAAKAPLILTPHAGEFARIAEAAGAESNQLRAFARKHRATTVLKGPVTRISDGSVVYHSFFGGPVLARGGSGDLLAGLIGGLIAQAPRDLLLAAARGTVWQGRAADVMARTHGQSAVNSTQLLDFLSEALRGSSL